MHEHTAIRDRYEQLPCENRWNESDPCLDKELRHRQHAQRVTRDMLQDMRLAVMKQELSQVRKLLEMLLCLVDPVDVKAALELRDATPAEADWRAMALRSGPPPELQGVQEEKPW